MLSSLSELWRAGEGWLYTKENTENETIDVRRKKPSKYFKSLLNKAKKLFPFQNDLSKDC